MTQLKATITRKTIRAGIKSAPSLPNPMTAQGDLIIGGASGLPGPLAIGAPGQRLTVSMSRVAGDIPQQFTQFSPAGFGQQSLAGQPSLSQQIEG